MMGRKGAARSAASLLPPGQNQICFSKYIYNDKLLGEIEKILRENLMGLNPQDAPSS
jgi:hypothetical protein